MGLRNKSQWLLSHPPLTFPVHQTLPPIALLRQSDKYDNNLQSTLQILGNHSQPVLLSKQNSNKVLLFSSSRMLFGKSTEHSSCKGWQVSRFIPFFLNSYSLRPTIAFLRCRDSWGSGSCMLYEVSQWSSKMPMSHVWSQEQDSCAVTSVKWADLKWVQEKWKA